MIGCSSQSAYSGYKAPHFLSPLFSCRLPLSCSLTSLLALSASASLILAISGMNVSSTFPQVTLLYRPIILLKLPSCAIPPQLILAAPCVAIYSGILYLSFPISTFLSFLIVSDILNSLFLVFIVCFPHLDNSLLEVSDLCFIYLKELEQWLSYNRCSLNEFMNNRGSSKSCSMKVLKDQTITFHFPMHMYQLERKNSSRCFLKTFYLDSLPSCLFMRG